MKDIKKFEEYTQDPLMDDIENVDTNDESIENKDWEIESIIDILTEDPTKSEESMLKNEAITFDTNVPKDVKRGDHIWITAMIKRKGTSYNDAGRTAVLKLRIIDIYYGLSHLNKVINR